MLDGEPAVGDRQRGVRPVRCARAPNRPGSRSSRRPLDPRRPNSRRGGEVQSELALPRAGLYPIRVEIRQGRRTLAEHVTFIERLATPDSGVSPRSTINLSIVAGIPDPGPEPDAARRRRIERPCHRARPARRGHHRTPHGVACLPSWRRRSRTIPSWPPASVRRSAVTRCWRSRTWSSTRRRRWPPARSRRSPASFARGRTHSDRRFRRRRPGATRGSRADAAQRRRPSMLRDLGVQLVVVPFDLYLALDSNQSAAIRSRLTDPTLLLASGLDGGGELAVSVVDPINELLETDRNDDRNARRGRRPPLRRPDGDACAARTGLPQLHARDPRSRHPRSRRAGRHRGIRRRASRRRLPDACRSFPGSTGPFLINDEQVHVTFPATAESGPDRPRARYRSRAAPHGEHVATMLPADDPRPPRVAR